MGYVKEFIAAYLETALWSSTNEDGTPLDDLASVDDLSPESVRAMTEDCVSFVWANRAALRESGQDAGQAGHDFWLTRNGHGAGFWDRGLGEVGERLTKASKPYGSCDLYVGDDGKVYTL